MPRAAANAVSGRKPGPTLRPRAENREKKAALPVARIAMPLTRRSCPGPSGERTNTTITPVWPCEPLFAPIMGGAVSLPLPADTSRIGAAILPLWREDLPPPGLFTEDEKKSRIKAGVAVATSGRSHLPAVRAVTGSFRCIKSRVKIQPAISLLRSLSRNPYCHNKKTGVTRVSSAKRGTPFGLDAPPQKLHRMKQR